MQLFKQYRPKTLSEVAGHLQQIETIKRLGKATGLAGRAFWLVGASGIGKTTLAGIVAADVADALNVIEIDASDATPARLDDVERDCRSLAIGDKPGRAVIINESHGLRKDSVRKLLVILERVPSHVVWIFTTTVDGMDSFDGIDSGPLLSRCTILNLKPDRQAFASRAKMIADSSGLGGAPLAEYVRLAEFCKDNLRAMLNQIETGCMIGGTS